MTTVSLKWTDSEGHEQFYSLSADEILIGRKSDADIILANASVSRHHAKLVRGKEGYSIIDLSNTNGTYVNGQRIKQQRLHHGDRICLGQNRMELCYLTGADESASTAPSSEAEDLEKSLASLTVVRQVAKEGKPIYMAGGISQEFAELKSILTWNVRSLACMPLRWMMPESDTAEIHGVLYVDSTRNMRELSGLDEKILNKLAHEAGNVFEKLEMIKSFEERRTLQLELALAQETQKNLQNELRTAEELRRAESQVLLSENAASMGRFAAALSHELNSPLGALKSALQTCNALAEKKATLQVEKRREAEEIEAQLRRSAIDSADRLHQIVLRMQRFTNMDRKEILLVDL